MSVKKKRGHNRPYLKIPALLLVLSVFTLRNNKNSAINEERF